MGHVNSRSSRNSPGEALHIGANGVALRPPVSDILEITDTQNMRVNIIDSSILKVSYFS